MTASLERLWWYRSGAAAQCTLREVLRDPDASDREVARRVRPYAVSHPFVATVRQQHERGDLELDQQLLDYADGHPSGRLEDLLERRRRRRAG
jgi:hypothetical protein